MPISLQDPSEADLAEAIVALMIQAARSAMNDAQFSLFAAHGIGAERLELLERIYAEKGKEFREFVREAARGMECKYNSMRWRLDCVLATKSARNIADLEYLIKLNVSNSQDILLDSDYATLKHLEYVIEEAIRQSTSKTARRIGRI